MIKKITIKKIKIKIKINQKKIIIFLLEGEVEKKNNFKKNKKNKNQIKKHNI